MRMSYATWCSFFGEKFQEGAVSGLSFIIDSGAIISMVLCVGT